MFLASPVSLALTVFVAALAYASLVALLRISGNRTVAKWNAFDIVVTVALGSCLATVILSDRTSVAQGVAAFAALVAFQFAITWLSVRFRAVERFVKARPVLLLCNGLAQEEALSRARVTLSELRAAVRGKGIGSLEDVAAVVLETDGTISVIPSLGPHRATALDDVDGVQRSSGGPATCAGPTSSASTCAALKATARASGGGTALGESH